MSEEDKTKPKGDDTVSSNGKQPPRNKFRAEAEPFLNKSAQLTNTSSNPKRSVVTEASYVKRGKAQSYGENENGVLIAVIKVLIIVAILIGIYFIATNMHKGGKIVCKQTGRTSLTGFGNCWEEEVKRP